MTSKVIVALPAFNEAKYIGDIVHSIRETIDCDILVLDDGSTDDTAEQAQEAGAVVVSHADNQGYGDTIIDILSLTRDSKYDTLVILDADNQHIPADIPMLLTKIQSGSDFVIGRRDRRDVPRYRYVGGRILSVLTALAAHDRVVDSQSGFKALSRRAIDTIIPIEHGMAITSEMVIQAFRRGLKVTEVPIRIRYSDDSSTYNPFLQGVYTTWRLLVIWFRRRW